MSSRRYTRLTNAFSKDLENHNYAVTLYCFRYNFMRPHMSLNKRTPTMDAGLLDHPVTWEWLIQRLP